jgi:5-methylcytosine-specific restriction endonuclease McrA
MTERPTRKCGNPQCFTFGPWKNGYCDLHGRRQDNARKEGRRWTEWQKFIDHGLRSFSDAFCQRVNGFGKRCDRPVKFWHHIVEVRERPDLELNWRNVVGVCPSCHPRPTDKDQGRFLPTLWRDFGSSDAVPQPLVKPGQTVPRDVELWDLENRRALFA